MALGRISSCAASRFISLERASADAEALSSQYEIQDTPTGLKFEKLSVVGRQASPLRATRILELDTKLLMPIQNIFHPPDTRVSERISEEESVLIYREFDLPGIVYGRGFWKWDPESIF